MRAKSNTKALKLKHLVQNSDKIEAVADVCFSLLLLLLIELNEKSFFKRKEMGPV